ncbi:MAG TPA: thioredoxin-dependent thiol peroxidase [Oligoflexia bacterium]|nr:thioredoxin-dependent thiol peroxidase [Oligoflexia bacterium]HMP49605.1 thioredoxin-dependent thiol peroxidase [Oligoflexia bacterium]
MPSLKPGSKAPSFSLENQNGEILSLKDIEEDYIALFFYPKDNTPGCTIEAQGFTALKKKFEKAKTLPIGISGGTTKTKQKFCEKAGLDVTLLSDEDGSIGEKYGVYGEKKFMGRTYLGYQRHSFLIGQDRKIIKIYDSVKPETHPEEILKDILSIKK